MRVLITGGTGLIGSHLARRLIARGDQAVVLTRHLASARDNPNLAGAERVEGDPTQPGPWQEVVAGCDAVVNLAGQPIFGKRWTAQIKRKIHESRVTTTENVAAAIGRTGSNVRVFVSASAIGYYGPHEDEELDETSPPGVDFMAQVCRDWEEAAERGLPPEVRLAVVRIGVVLARDEGALGVMGPLFRLAPGAPVGSAHPLVPATGRQWMSWIHVEDVVGILMMALDQPEARGPINATSPNPARNSTFTSALSRALRSFWTPWRFALPIGPPDFVLRMVLGEVAQVVTEGVKVLPRRALEMGYAYRYPELDGALAEIYGKTASKGAAS